MDFPWLGCHWCGWLDGPIDMITVLLCRVGLALCGLKTKPVYFRPDGKPYYMVLAGGTATLWNPYPTMATQTAIRVSRIQVGDVEVIQKQTGGSTYVISGTPSHILTRKEPRALLREDGKWIISF